MFDSDKDQDVALPDSPNKTRGTGEAFRRGGLTMRSPWIDVLVKLRSKIFF